MKTTTQQQTTSESSILLQSVDIEITRCKLIAPSLVRVEFIEREREVSVHVNMKTESIHIRYARDCERPEAANAILKHRAKMFYRQHGGSL